MASEYKLSFTGEQIDERLKKVSEAVTFTDQNLSQEQKRKARENIGVESLPATTVADAGKFLRVGADGTWGVEAVINGMEVAY